MGIVVILCVVGLLLPGCPNPGGPAPSIKMTGSYAGEWQVHVQPVQGGPVITLTIPIVMALVHIPSLPYPANFETGGALTVDWDALPEGIEIPEEMQVSVPVAGTLDINGGNTLTFDALVCQETTCVLAGMRGVAIAAEDGFMMRYEGLEEEGHRLELAITVDNVTILGVGGPFWLERVAEE